MPPRFFPHSPSSRAQPLPVSCRSRRPPRLGLLLLLAGLGGPLAISCSEPAPPATADAPSDAPRAPGVMALTVFLPEGTPLSTAEAALAAALQAQLPHHARVEQIPPTLDQSIVLAQVVERSSLQPPAPELLQAHSPEVSPAQLQQIHAATHAVTLVALTLGDGAALGRTVAAVDRAVSQLTAAVGGIALDDDTLQLLPAPTLAQRAEGGVLAHTTVRVEQVDGALRAVTLGMARYGAPELVIARFSAPETTGVHALLELARQGLVERPGLPREGRLVLDIAQLQEPAVRQAQLEKLEPGATGQGLAGLRRVEQARESDPENVLLELLPEPDLQGLLLSLYGTTRPGPDLLTVARDAARKELLGPVRARFQAGLPPEDRLLVKGPFADAAGTVEWMWVAVERWEPGVLTGLLTNTPHNIPGLHEGALVEVQETEAFDYLYVHADGRTEGNRTAALLELGD